VGTAVGVDRLVDALGEAQMRDLLGKPPPAIDMTKVAPQGE
jgi:hypothetical protein